MENVLQGAFANRGQSNRELTVSDDPGSVQEYVVTLLNSQVGYRKEEDLTLSHSQLRSDGGPNSGTIADEGLGVRKVNAVNHHSGAWSERCRQGVMGRLRYRHQALFGTHGVPNEGPTYPRCLIPNAVLGIDDAGAPRPGQRSYHQLTEGGRVGKVEMNYVVVTFEE